MVSLTVTILFFALVFAGVYFVYRMNRERALHRGSHPHQQMQAATRRPHTSNSENQGRGRNTSENTRQL